jgi:nucleoside-diphosphate-sugar epimerase
VVLGEGAVLSSGKNYCILRLAGLIGANRHPVKYLSGRTIENGNMRVNLINRKDVINAIIHVIEKDHWNDIFNLCSPEHPSKADYYNAEARKQGIPAPTFLSSDKIGKEVSSDKIHQELGFQYETSIYSA